MKTSTIKSFMLLFLISLHFGLWAQQNPAIVINELSASGQSTSEDDTGANSTWIELYNPSEETVNLRGWFLTDDYSYLPKWQFPEISLQAGEFLVVYTSGQNKTNPDSSLHTNFEFKPGGQFMGLVFTDGKTLVDEYKPGYGVNHIPQVTYGRAQKHSSIDLVGRKSPGKLLVPTAEDDESIGQSWKNNQSLSFDDGAWSNVTGSVGYDTREGTDQSGNLALGKVASQSSTWPGFTAEYAVDGVLTNFAHTADGDETPWWEVDLGESLLIGEVVLHNRRGCCNDRLNSIIVEIRNEAQEVIYTSEKLNPVAAGETPTSPGDELTLSLEDAPVHGRYVRVRKDPAPGTNTYLTLAEVEIIGSENYDQHITTNVQAAMKGVNASAYLRYGFTLEETEDIDELYLHAAFDGGFEAYLNGKQIASANAPDEVTYRSAAASDTPMYQEESIRVPKTYLQSGENILAVHVMNHHVDDQSLLMDLRLEAVKIGDPEKRYFYHPTPGTPNGNSVSGFTAKTIASHKGGFYEDPVELTLSAGAAGETLAFTLDGSVPSLTNGTLVRPATTSSIADTTFVIDRTTVIRSAAYQSDKWRNTISTYSFLFIDDVITSEVMNPEITGDERYSRSMREALEALPTVSLVMPNGAVNDDYLIATSVEWLEPGQSSSFQVDAGVRYFGGAFTDFDKENFRLYFKSEYGVSKLRYPLFEGFGRGIAPVEKFDQLELRAGSHDMVMRGFYMSNRFTDDTMLDMGNLNPHGRFVHLYINGTYWGQYHLRERWNADMHAQYLGGEKVEYEAINGNWNQGGWADPGEPYDGDGSFWETAKSLREDFEAIQDYVDVAHYVDFMLLYMFGRSENEYRTVAPATPGAGGFKFYLNDADGFLRSSGNRTGWKQPGRTNADGPGSIFSMLYKEGHPKFKALVADRIYEHYFNDGALTFEKNRDRLLQRCNEVETAFLAESARWGYRTPESWREARDNYINDVLTTRTEDVIVDFRGAGFLPAAEPPQVVVDGATLLSDSTSSYQQAKVELKATSGAVYYTLDGSDPYAIPNHAEHNTAEIRTLIGENAPKTAWIPDGPVAEDWKTNAAFDDAGWLQGTGGVGYETGNGYQDWIGINVTSMKGSNTSCLVRIPFELDETSLKDIGALTLLMRMDDGFVAYLNGVEVQRQNVNGDPQWNTKASSGHEAGNSWSTFDISPYIGVLTEGTNLLAIHGANLSLNSSDFLISAMLTAAPSNDQVNYLSANAETYEGSFSLTHSSLLKTRTFHNGEWSPLRTVWIEVTGNEAVLASEDQSSLIHCYPNPFDSQVTIEFQSSTSGSALLEIFDLSGAIMYHKLQDVRPGTVQFRLAPKGWSGGIYIMQLTAPDGQKHRGKLVHIN